MQKVILKPGKEKPILNRHHWIFSGAIDTLPTFEDGSILEVYSSEDRFLGYGYFNTKSNITGRMLTFSKMDPMKALKENILKAYRLRQELFDENVTNCYRLINGEGDEIPGLIVDKYNKALCIQISTLGMANLKDTIVDLLNEILEPVTIFEKSNMPARRQEGLQSEEGLLFGRNETVVDVIENGIKFRIDLANSHKTGFYLDQREMRSLVEKFSKGKKVLNCFSYTGGFSLYAYRGGAVKVDSVDISEEVINQAKENFEINGYKDAEINFYAEDVFKFLRNHDLNYDFIILDPPAFAKKKEDVPRALGGYRDINRVTLKNMPRGSYLLTCSCSYHVDEESFLRMLFQAATESGKSIKIVQRHRLAMDHTINVFHPEANYLKSYLLWVD